MKDEDKVDVNAEPVDGDNEGMMAGKPAVQVRLRRIMALVMLVLFAALVVNIMFFHVMIGETAILYMALVAVFFLGNGMRGGARRYDGQEPGEPGEPEELGELGESGEPCGPGEPGEPCGPCVSGETGTPAESGEPILVPPSSGNHARIGLEKSDEGGKRHEI